MTFDPFDELPPAVISPEQCTVRADQIDMIIDDMAACSTRNLEIVPYTIDEKGNYYSFTRGSVANASATTRKGEFDSISSYFTGIITGSHNQDVSCLVVGNKGAGKSFTVLSLCYQCARKISAFVNNGDESRWPDYYNLHALTACILEEECSRLMNIQQRYVVKNFDDVSIGWNSRSWRDEGNSNKNDVFTVNRTDNCIQFMSAPHSFMIDKVPRSLVSHYIEMDEKYFDQGFTTIKLFKPITMFRQGKIINPYLSIDNRKYVAYVIPKPPQELYEAYNKLREKCKNIAIKQSREKMEGSAEKKKADTPSDKKRQQWAAWLGRAAPEVNVLVGKGMEPEKALYKVAVKQGQTRGAIGYLIRSGTFEKYGFVPKPVT